MLKSYNVAPKIFLKIGLAITISLFLFLESFGVVQGQDSYGLEIFFFYAPGCPHCAAEEKFLEHLIEKYPEITIRDFSVYDKEGVQLLQELYQSYQVPAHLQGLVPATFISDKYFIGFSEGRGEEIEKYILGLREENNLENNQENTLRVPFLGEIDPSKFSLPLLAVILGFFDGFNVCSLGALVLILGIVLALRSRKKILAAGGTYILVTGVIYGALMFLWRQIFIVLSPYIRKMEILIGALAIFGGLYFLREFLKFRKRGLVCDFDTFSKRISQRFQKTMEKKTGILAIILGVLLFAATITIVEFPCSAVLPVIFVGILAEAKVPLFLSLVYLGIFLFFYLLDEIIMFLVAVFTLRIWVTSSKSVIWLNLLASVVLIFLGVSYLAGLI